MISLIHPSRSRPALSENTIHTWIIRSALGVNNLEVILCLDDDDDKIEDYRQNSRIYDKIIVGKFGCAVAAINAGAAQSTGDLMIVVSDDTDCPERWDRFLLTLVDGKTDWILKTNDGTQPWIITNPIMDRTYYNRFGYIYHPGYKHMFCDTELTCVADLTGRKITSNVLFKHNHYSVTKTQPDEISKRADATWNHGEKLFLERYKRNFDLKPEDIKGKIQDNGMINWLQRKVKV